MTRSDARQSHRIILALTNQKLGGTNLRQARRVVSRFRPARGEVRAVVRSLIFFLKLYRLLPFDPIDWVTPQPIIEKLAYRIHTGRAEADVYRPPSDGPHPGVVVCLGVVPFGVEHPQVPRLGQALARAGFAAMLYWSPAMRDLRLDPADIADLASAYETLLGQPYVDRTRSGFLGTCVGGSFALMAAASPRIRDRLAYVSAYAPYCSLWTFARDVASATRTFGDRREPWEVDPLTWKTFVRTMTDWLQPREAQGLRDAFEDHFHWDASKSVIIRSPMQGHLDPGELSENGQAVFRLLTATDSDGAEMALRLLPPAAQARLAAMSPVTYVNDIEAPLIVLLHDRYDPVIPVGESRDLWSALSGRAGVRYTELGFRHLEPSKLSPLRLAKELPRSYLAMYPIFRQAMA